VWSTAASRAAVTNGSSPQTVSWTGEVWDLTGETKRVHKGKSPGPNPDATYEERHREPACAMTWY